LPSPFFELLEFSRYKSLQANYESQRNGENAKFSANSARWIIGAPQVKVLAENDLFMSLLPRVKDIFMAKRAKVAADGGPLAVCSRYR
jgi:hypothetical protein